MVDGERFHVVGNACSQTLEAKSVVIAAPRASTNPAAAEVDIGRPHFINTGVSRITGSSPATPRSSRAPPVGSEKQRVEPAQPGLVALESRRGCATSLGTPPLTRQPLKRSVEHTMKAIERTEMKSGATTHSRFTTSSATQASTTTARREQRRGLGSCHGKGLSHDLGVQVASSGRRWGSHAVQHEARRSHGFAAFLGAPLCSRSGI